MQKAIWIAQIKFFAFKADFGSMNFDLCFANCDLVFFAAKAAVGSPPAVNTLDCPFTPSPFLDGSVVR